jgi:hypothetical protein
MEIDVDFEDLFKFKGVDTLIEVLKHFSDSDIMDAVELIDNNKGGWAILQRSTVYVDNMSKELKNEIVNAYADGELHEDAYHILCKLNGYQKE